MRKIKVKVILKIFWGHFVDLLRHSLNLGNFIHTEGKEKCNVPKSTLIDKIFVSI